MRSLCCTQLHAMKIMFRYFVLQLLEVAVVPAMVGLFIFIFYIFFITQFIWLGLRIDCVYDSCVAEHHLNGGSLFIGNANIHIYIYIYLGLRLFLVIYNYSPRLLGQAVESAATHRRDGLPNLANHRDMTRVICMLVATSLTRLDSGPHRGTTLALSQNAAVQYHC